MCLSTQSHVVWQPSWPFWLVDCPYGIGKMLPCLYFPLFHAQTQCHANKTKSFTGMAKNIPVAHCVTRRNDIRKRKSFTGRQQSQHLGTLNAALPCHPGLGPWLFTNRSRHAPASLVPCLATALRWRRRWRRRRGGRHLRVMFVVRTAASGVCLTV